MDTFSKTVQVEKPSNEFFKLAEQAAKEEIYSRSDATKETTWISMGNELEITGFPNDQISTLMKRSIEDRIWELEYKELEISREEYTWHSGHFYRVMKKNDWTNQERNFREVPPRELENSSINTPNKQAIHLLFHIEEICKITSKKLKEQEELGIFFDQKNVKEFYQQQSTIIKNMNDAFDDKTKVSINTEQILLHCLATALGSLSNGAEHYMEKRIELFKEQNKKLLSPKQAIKFQRGEKISKLPLLKPRTRDTAIFLGYYGVQCVCGSWRVRPKSDSDEVECYDCDKSFSAKTVSKCRYCQIPLYKEDLLHIIKTKKCENCDTEIKLPQEVINYALSEQIILDQK
ncbi:hypothetical protein LCGC14_0380520 [marine sediment metagenome]|uniref:Uncharacterized protein n=1 Tax=marine sediment metagenome TaxID=412755 RepID=A0A0F9VPP7_9ZZZZ